MTDRDDAVRRQYSRPRLGERILAALAEAGVDVDKLKRDDLMPLEEFHIGGRGTTRELASLAELQKNELVLDVGCGIGGPARTLAAEFGCRVTGVDITQDYCDTATLLTDRVGLSDRVLFRRASALDLPFEDGSFDTVWTQHVSMNIEDKNRLYRELLRVLKTDGRLVFHDILTGNGETLRFPTFWADTPEISFLATPQLTRDILKSLGFTVVHWVDVTDSATTFFERTVAASESGTAPRLGMGVLVGPETPLKAKNMLENLKTGRIQVVQAVCRRD